MLPHMTDDELDLFSRFLSNAETYYEFGCGGSTTHAMSFNLKEIVSVDSNLEWINKVKESKVAKKFKGHLTIKHIDINGDPNAWGKPKDESKKENWPAYSRSILSHDYKTKPDIILVDGRFRVASTLQSIKKMGEHTLLLIHDYTNREYYHIIEDFLRPTISVGTLTCFLKRGKINFNKMSSIVIKYENDFR